MSGIIQAIAAGGGAAAIAQALTWDSGHKGANVSISGSQITPAFNAQGTCLCLQGKSSGKFYFEFVLTQAQSGTNQYCGVETQSGDLSFYPGLSDTLGWAVNYGNAGTQTVEHNGAVATATGAASTSGDTVGIAVDFSADTIFFYRNNTLIYTFTSAGIGGATIYPAGNVSDNGAGNSAITSLPSTLKYTPPTGFTVWA